jgi:cytochrome c2
MHSRSVVVVAFVWLLTLVGATWGGGELPQDPKRPPAFSHRDHVVPNWADPSNGPEVFRDCRGCHRFDQDNLVSSPQAHCDACHFGTGALDAQFAAGNEKRLEGFASRTRSAFRHHTHGMLECRECHQLDVDRIRGSLPLRTGPGQCARCHEQSQARAAVDGLRWFEPATQSDELARACGLEGRFTIPTDKDAYAQKLDRVFAGDGEGINALLEVGGGDFTHGDHLSISCTDCHAGIQGASATEVGTGAIAAKGCADCHKRSAVEAARVAEPTTEKRPSWSLGAFAHEDHYRDERTEGVCTQDAYAKLAGGDDKTCQHCHTYRPEREGFAGRDFPFDGETSKHRYRDCQQCHAVPGWSTGELQAGKAPLHGSSSADGSSGWVAKQCTACHEFGQPDIKGRRPEVEVQRWSEKTFVFRGQTHPFVTSAEPGSPAVQGECRKCHRAVVPALPSRLIEKTFRHETHLPPVGTELTSANCVGCHATAASSTSSQTLAVDYRTYDEKVCSTCHRGGELRVDVEQGAVPASRAAVAFPHGPHSAGMDCSACHQRGAENITTKPSALRCNECHNHVADDDGPSTEYLFGDEVQSCVQCHHTPAAPDIVDVPSIRGTEASLADARYGLETGAFAGFTDRQFHPLGSECSQCHRANTFEVGGRQRLRPILARAANFVFAALPTGSGDFHRGQPKERLKQQLQNQPAGCMSCHWKDFGTLSEWGMFPELPAERARLGNDFANWPGLKSNG